MKNMNEFIQQYEQEGYQIQQLVERILNAVMLGHDSYAVMSGELSLHEIERLRELGFSVEYKEGIFENVIKWR